MIGIRVSITRHISDDPQPGVVECEFFDANGERHCFVEKVAIVTSDDIDATSTYPCPGFIACMIANRFQAEDGREIIVVDTQRPWDVESTAGLTKFSVTPEALIEIWSSASLAHPSPWRSA